MNVEDNTGQGNIDQGDERCGINSKSHVWLLKD
jgi:hypothetical protein